MHEYGSLPRAVETVSLKKRWARSSSLYDQDSHIGHCLSPIAACVWRHCDGERDMTELAELAGTSKDLVADALHELREKGLLDAEPELPQDTVPGVSRREAIVRAARYGAAAAGASMIISATAATPAMAASPNCTCVSEKDATCCCCEDGQCITISSGNCNTQCANAGHMGSKEAGKPEMRCSP